MLNRFVVCLTFAICVLLLGLPQPAIAALYLGTASASFSPPSQIQGYELSGGFVWPTYVQLPMAYDQVRLAAPAATPRRDARLGATAFVIFNGSEKICLVSVDVLAIQRSEADTAAAQIAVATGIPANNVLISATHTHYTPAMLNLHGVEKNPAFPQIAVATIVEAATNANTEANQRQTQNRQVEAYFSATSMNANGEAVSPVGGYWDYRQTLSVLAFQPVAGNTDPTEFIFSYPAHGNRRYSGAVDTIGPGVFGLAAQELELQYSGSVAFFPGTLGGAYFGADTSTSTETLVDRLKSRVNSTLAALTNSNKLLNHSIASAKPDFTYNYRKPDPAAAVGDGPMEAVNRRIYEDFGVSDIQLRLALQKRSEAYLGSAEDSQLPNPDSGTTKLQQLQLGDFTIYAMPGELFPQYGFKISDSAVPAGCTRGNANALQVSECVIGRDLALAISNDYLGYVPYSGPDVHTNYDYQSIVADHSFAPFEVGNQMISALGLTPFPSANTMGGEKKDSPAYNLSNVQTFQNWSTSWDKIVPLNISEENSSRLAFLDRETGQLNIGELTSSGAYSHLASLILPSTAWDDIIAVDCDGDGVDEILLWDKDTGGAQLNEIVGTSLQLVASYGWALWDQIISIEADGDLSGELLFWNRDSGVTHVLGFGAGGVTTLIKEQTGWPAFDSITAINFTGKDADNVERTDIVARSASGKTWTPYRMMANAELKPIVETHFDQDYSSSMYPAFDRILPWRYDSDNREDMLFWDKDTGWTWVLRAENAFIRPSTTTVEYTGGAFTFVKEHRYWAPWTDVIPLSKAGIDRGFLFWNAQNGSASLVISVPPND